jgi:hypothetical protein
MGNSQQAWENREYVRRLLKERQPEFAAALELAAHHLSDPRRSIEAGRVTGALPQFRSDQTSIRPLSAQLTPVRQRSCYWSRFAVRFNCLRMGWARS